MKNICIYLLVLACFGVGSACAADQSPDNHNEIAAMEQEIRELKSMVQELGTVMQVQGKSRRYPGDCADRPCYDRRNQHGCYRQYRHH